MKLIYTIILTLAIPSIVSAVPAFKGDIEFQQADKTTFTAKLKGDEWFSWVEDSKGNVITFNKASRNYEYGIVKTINGSLELVPSGVKANDQRSKSSTITSVKKIDHNILSQIWKEKKSQALSHK